MLINNSKNNNWILKDKTNFELLKSFFIFKIISLKKISNPLIIFAKFALKLHLPIKFIIKKTIYSQFCGGENLDECNKTIESLYKKDGSHPSQVGAFLVSSVFWGVLTGKDPATIKGNGSIEKTQAIQLRQAAKMAINQINQN